MILTAALLALLAILLAWPVPLAVARSAWPDRAPGIAMLLWQAIALAGVLSLLGCLLVAGLVPYGDHLVAAIRTLATDVRRGFLPPGTTYASALALAAAVLLGAHLVANLAFTIIRTERQRARHRSLLLLLSQPMPTAPRTRVLDAAAPVAYCLPGTARSLTVLSAGLLALLDEQEVAGVVEHERAHLRQHHALVLTAFHAWRIALPWFPVASRAQDAVGLLTEMLADDEARRRVPDPVLARAITAVASGGGTLPGAGVLGHAAGGRGVSGGRGAAGGNALAGHALGGQRLGGQRFGGTRLGGAGLVRGAPAADAVGPAPADEAPAAAAASVERRVRRLLNPSPVPPAVRILVPAAAVALVVVPPVLLALPALTG